MLTEYKIDDIVEQLTNADKMLNNGSVSYNYRIMDGETQTMEVSATTVFKPDRFNWNRHDCQGSGRMVFDGQDSISIFGEGTDEPHINITPGKFFFHDVQYRYQEVYPGPCFFGGRGLSEIKGWRIISTFPCLTLSAPASNGYTFEAELLPDQDFLAKRIVLRDKLGNHKRSWNLDTPMRATGGPIIAAHCILRRSGQSKYEDCTITAASCYIPEESVFQVLLVPGLDIFDMRLGQRASIYQSGPTTITKEQLLDMTRKYLADESKRQRLTKTLPFLIALALITPIALIAFYFKRNR